ncbi:MaoC family dehydratase [Pararhodobacter zhoushanensis]|uniref:MaoC/PaaZ C-terminal domain-containing protein n=1 Tax=Pararhodobacter zhoushanensis TaxID=2479545 RepID=A0ABT3H5B3_9RHOB|nr:MaoC family dehydratase [Pararhodobacter zhoushanensis]MCW1934994.1 MaoC/PaaZ C-terminal domain-containing protein [Pararhodobacter zhoushanensis]
MTITERGLLGWKFAPIPFRVTARDAIVFGLSLGLGSAPTDARQLRHVYENGLVPYPTMPVVLGSPGMWFGDAGLDARKVLHGAQALEVLAPVPLDTDLVALNAVSDLVDRGPDKGAVVEVTRRIETADGAPVAKVVSTYMCMGDGGFGGSKTRAATAPVSHPGRDADLRATIPTLPQAALLYRLNGDLNPLHADPAMAARLGFDRPILHGLCTLGHTARALIDTLCDGDATRLRSLSAKMSRPVFPGETLEVSIWREGGQVLFETAVAERGVTVLSGGCIGLEGMA